MGSGPTGVKTPLVGKTASGVAHVQGYHVPC